jgi:hypothetical protein
MFVTRVADVTWTTAFGPPFPLVPPALG